MIERNGTHGDEDDRIQTRSRTLLQPEHRTRQAHLLHLPEHIQSKTRNDHCGDADASCARLNGHEQNENDRSHCRCEPRMQLVDCATHEGSHADAKHADQAE